MDEGEWVRRVDGVGAEVTHEVHWDYDSEALFNAVLMSWFYMGASGARAERRSLPTRS